MKDIVACFQGEWNLNLDLWEIEVYWLMQKVNQ